MSTGESQFELPSKIEAYLATLSRLYAKKKESRLQEIVVNGAPTVHEQWSHENWDGDIYAGIQL